MNLLQETLNVLKENGKNENDIEYVMWRNTFSKWEDWEIVYMSFAEFKTISNKEYSNWFWGQEVQDELKIVWKDFWIERHEYDWSEWWEFKQLPTKPVKEWSISIFEYWY